MAPPLNPSGLERVGSAFARISVAAISFVLPLAGGFAIAWSFASSVHNRNFPWITGRALGIAGYLSLTALVAVGLWMRHPWRFKVGFGHPETRLRAHATLGIATLALVIGHLVFLATDRYAGVGWVGAIVPGLSRYRPVAVGLGVGAFELLVLIASTAHFAGRRWTNHWLGIHRLATITFAISWFHGVLAGTDTAALRIVYVVSGAIIVLLVVSRTFVSIDRTSRSRLDSEDIDHEERDDRDHLVGASK